MSARSAAVADLRKVARRTRAGATDVGVVLRPDRRVLRAMLSLLGGYVAVAAAAAAVLARHPDPRTVFALAPVALIAALVLAPVALGLLLVLRRRRGLHNPAMATLGACVAVATASLGALVVVSLP